MDKPRVRTIGDVNDSTVMYINKGNAIFARESKGNAHGTQGERSNPAKFADLLLLPRLQTIKQTVTTSKHSIEFSYSDFPGHFKVNSD